MSTSVSAAPFNTTLADELDQDFAASGSEPEDDERDEEAEAARRNGDDADEKMDEDEPATSGPLSDSRWRELEDVLQKIAQYKAQPETHTGVDPDNDPQYKLMARANTFSTSIDDHMAELLKRIRDLYSARFPELETLLPDPLEYTKTVALIGNGPMHNLTEITSPHHLPIKKPLTAILSRPKLMTVTVEATTTKGAPLSEQHLSMVQSACAKMLHLESAKTTIQDYVESCMNLFCPNLTMLLGSHTAAQLVTARGGLQGLAQTRSANIASIGSKRFAASGFATNTGIRGQGYLYESELISRFRPELKTQAMRIVSGKLVLAARIDLSRTSPSGAEGATLLEQCEKRLDKLTEAAPNKGQRALPAPDDKPSKKRGGRRARKAKEATATTDLRKAQNRMRFGQEEAEVGYGTGDGTAGLGMIGQQDDGRVRAMQVDQRTRAKLSKKNLGWAAGGSGAGGAASSLRGFGQGGAGGGATSVLKGHGLRTSGVATSLGTGTAGTTSSLAFGARQGLELVDPTVRDALERKDRADQDRWFKGGTFTQINANGGAGGGADGFKKPALPAKRKADEVS